MRLNNEWKVLSVELAKRARILKDFIIEELELKDSKSQFIKVYDIFQKTMIRDLTPELFADIYSQIICFGLLFFKLSKNAKLTRYNILEDIPHYIPLLKDVYNNARFDKWENSILWILDEVILLLNNIDSKIIKQSLSYKDLSILEKRNINLEDPFLYFYEEFLKVYDKNTKVNRGVFYTPESVVSFIIRSIDIVLKTELGIKKGFLEQSIKVLDFATGTGTFILALIEYIKNELWKTNNYGLFNTEVNEFILKNIYGFELLAVPYIICHLRIHEYLETYGFRYTGGKKERAEIYLTNTLENSTNIQLTNFFDDINEEASLAYKVKNEEEILVIMGNPPYSVSSSNKTEFIEELMKSYKQNVLSEKNIQPLSDDYIKFLRFAHWKMEKVNKGVIGVITNNSFIDGIIHRGMREELSKTFDKIYILNLHGNSNIGDICLDGSKDENIFDIKQGVCISLFIKNVMRASSSPQPQAKRTQQSIDQDDRVTINKIPIYYYSLQGLRSVKYDFLYSKDIKTVLWQELPLESPYYWFKQKDMSLQGEYSKFWSMVDIFEVYSVGVVTGDDFKKIKFTESPERLDFYFRPFDFRYLDFDDSELQRPRLPFMFLYKKYNIGLLTSKQCKKNFTHSLVTYTPSSKHIIGDAAYNFPLYTYYNDIPKINFTTKFTEFWKNDSFWKTKTAEEILSYIYACLHSNLYRKKYFEFLKIDFPRVPFDITLASNSQTQNIDRDGQTTLYNKLITLGKELIDLHLFKTDFESNIANFPISNPDLKVSIAKYEKGKVYINKTTYFENVPEEVWIYEIGGYVVLDKWLKERKKHDYTLTGSDLNHFLKMVNVITRTIKLQKAMD